jgi:hypothetical protein
MLTFLKELKSQLEADLHEAQLAYAASPTPESRHALEVARDDWWQLAEVLRREVKARAYGDAFAGCTTSTVAL